MGIQINGQTDTISAVDNNFSLAGNVSIGGTLTYEDVTSVDAVGLSTFQAGIHLDDSITHLGDTNTKIRFPAADTITAETGGSERLRITGIGNVGIGEDSPDVRLHVKETIDTAYSLANVTSDANHLLKLENPSTTANAFSGMQFRIGSGADLFFGAIQQSVNHGDFFFANQNSPNAEIMRIKSTGSVGIGTDNPSVPLHINGTNGIIVDDSTNGKRGEFRSKNDIIELNAYDPTDSNAAVPISFKQYTSERLQISSGGDVGINCTPTEKFHINGGDGVKIKLDCPNDYSNSSSIIMSQERGEIKTTINASGGNPGGSMVLRTRNTAGTMVDAITIESSQQVSINSAAGTHPLTVSNGGSEKLRITSAGISQFTATGRVATFTGNGIEINNSLGSNVFIGTQSGTEGKMGTVNNANMSLFANNNYAKRAELQTSGSFSILDGDLIVANGHGINFGSTTPDGTPSSEVLDDYEEGTWTPTLPNGGTMIAVYNARYTKIGRLVNVYCYINTGSIPSNGTEFRIGGLPFNCANGQYYPSGSIGYTAAFNFDPWRPLARTNDNFIYFHRCDGNQTVAVNSNASGLAALLFTLTYSV